MQETVMTDSEERRIAGILSQMGEMLDHRLPTEMPRKRPEWQIWTFIIVAVFYGGASWYQIEQNSKSINKHLEADAKRVAAMEADIDDNKENMVSHMQWELEHEIELRDERLQALENALEKK
ncbi:MAG: hypothetical protein ACE5DN_03705 [Flavobacteriales bacterium]